MATEFTKLVFKERKKPLCSVTPQSVHKDVMW